MAVVTLPEMVIENPSSYCTADPGREYLVYLRYGGSFKLDLSGFSDAQVFGCKWIDLVNNKVSTTSTFQGGKIMELKCPEDYPGFTDFKDWVVHIYAVDH